MTDDYGLLASGLPPEIAAQAKGLTRRQAIAQAMLDQSQTPLDGNRMAGGYVVPISPFEGLAKMAQSYFGRKSLDEADKQMADLSGQYQNMTADEVAQYARRKAGSPAMAPATPNDDEGNAMPNVAGSAPDPVGAVTSAMTSRNPMLQKLGAMDFQAQQQDKTRADDRAFRAAESAENRAARMQERVLMLDSAAQNAALSREERAVRAKEAADLRRELATMSDATRRDMASQNAALRRDSMAAADAARQQKNTPKLPTPALKLQQEEMDAIGTASSISADLDALNKQITGGELNLGPVANVVSQGRNALGLSDDNSQNFASFKASIEKIRNDSLRLNKGVQTEGDAIRAMNEIMANLNDPGVVSKRLSELKKINERAVNLRKNNIDVIRSNYGVDPLDTSRATNVPAAVGASGGWVVVK